MTARHRSESSLFVGLSCMLFFGFVAPAAGQGMPFHTNTALPLSLAEAGLRGFFQYTELGVRSRGSDAGTLPGDPDLRVGALPLMVPYAIRPGTFVMVALPYLDKRLDQGGTTRANRGLGDVTLLVKQELMAADVVMGNRRLALFASATLPTGETEEGDEPLPPPLRLGGGTTFFRGEAVYSYVQNQVGIHAGAGYVVPAGTEQGVRPGDAFTFDLALGYRFLPRRLETLRERTWQAYLELNGSVVQSSTQDAVPMEGTGGTTIFLSPGLQWIPLLNLAVEGSVQFPVVRHPRGTQMMPEWSTSIGVRALVGPFGT